MTIGISNTFKFYGSDDQTTAHEPAPAPHHFISGPLKYSIL